jgi:hypothetical protein
MPLFRLKEIYGEVTSENNNTDMLLLILKLIN